VAEADKLYEAVAEFGLTRLDLIAAKVGTRTEQQCKTKLNNNDKAAAAKGRLAAELDGNDSAEERFGGGGGGSGGDEHGANRVMAKAISSSPASFIAAGGRRQGTLDQHGQGRRYRARQRCYLAHDQGDQGRQRARAEQDDQNRGELQQTRRRGVGVSR
jgi:hypothetical protein